MMKLPPLTFRTLGRVLKPVAGLVLANRPCRDCEYLREENRKLSESLQEVVSHNRHLYSLLDSHQRKAYLQNEPPREQ